MNTINFAARFEYISAIEIHWPEVLISLRQRVLPVFVRCLESRGDSTAIENLARLSDALERKSSPDLEQVAQAVRTWAEEFGFLDKWLQDVALQTMDSWARDKTKSNWTYSPEELRLLKFEVDFGVWFPVRGIEGHLDWLEFKQLVDTTYRRKLAAYRAKVRKMWGEGSSKLAEHALWTVRWQRGISPGRIQIDHRRATGVTLSTTNIQKAVHEFAAAAGLILRKRRGGGAKNTTTE
jgi:hypothetical protein